MDFSFKDIWEWSQRECNLLGLAAEDDTVILGLEPLHGVLLGQAVREHNVSNLAAPVMDIHAGTAKDNIEVCLRSPQQKFSANMSWWVLEIKFRQNRQF